MAVMRMHGAGEIVRRFRVARSMSIDDLAVKSGCSRRLIQQFESNVTGMTDKKLSALAVAFDVPPDVLGYECLMAAKPELKATKIGKLFREMTQPGKVAKKSIRKPRKVAT
jgi:transcriptional regulator with XRE-family HTH domain